MTLSSESPLTTLESRMLAALTEPLPSTTLFETLAVGYPYGIKVLRKLKHKKLIGSIQRGNHVLYYTIRTSQTEALFSARARATGKAEWLMPFAGELMTLLEVARKIKRKREVYSNVDVFTWAGHILYTLRWNSHRKENNLATQRPYAEEMRLFLEQRLALARFELAFIEELMKAPIWDDSTQTWKNIATEAPTEEQGKISSEWLNERMYRS